MSEQTAIISPTLTDWFSSPRWSVFTAHYELKLLKCLTAYVNKPKSLFTLQLRKEEHFKSLCLSNRNKQMLTKGFLFIFSYSQSRMEFLKAFSCSKFDMFTVEDCSKCFTRHGSVIAMLHLPSTPPTSSYYRNSYYISRWPAILQTRTT